MLRATATMRKPIFKVVLLMGLLAWLLSGCGYFHPSDGPGMEYVDSEYRTPYANVFPFDEFESNTVPSCAVAYLGHGAQGLDNRDAAIERFFGELEHSDLYHFNLGGEDFFLVVPRHKDSFSVAASDGERLHPPGPSGTPFTVQCDGSGGSDVTVSSRDGSFVLRVDEHGMLDCGELVLDVTDFDVS